jgi:hypothetical protein
MKSQPIGIATSEVEVLNISPRGFGLWLEPQEYFLSFEDFPWFQSATIAQICHVVRVSEDHLYWPDLEVDLHRESLEHPERFPLKASG